MRSISRRQLLAAGLAVGVGPIQPAWRAGTARECITPQSSLWMAGYAARTKPSEGVLHDLYCRALALDDGRGPAVLVTADILGWPGDVAERIAERCRIAYGLERSRLLLNSSHTHGGPVISDTLRVAYDMTASQWSDVGSYTAWLEERTVACISRALRGLQPTTLRYSRGQAGFSINRRRRQTDGTYTIAANLDGPTDQGVPVLEVDRPDGTPLAAVFGYACHNTTLGADVYRFHGDYAGFAATELEARHRGMTALYVAGCGADQNPNPRGKLEQAIAYGTQLADAVDNCLHGAFAAPSGPLKTAFGVISLPFVGPASQSTWLARLSDKSVYIQRHTRLMQEIGARHGRPPTSHTYPVQVWRFGRELTLVALAGEVVVDYSLRLAKELAPPIPSGTSSRFSPVWVAGYCNDVFAYIPSERVLAEGGYEGGGAMLYYGQPGPFAAGVEQRIINEVHRLMREAS